MKLFLRFGSSINNPDLNTPLRSECFNHKGPPFGEGPQSSSGEEQNRRSCRRLKEGGRGGGALIRTRVHRCSGIAERSARARRGAERQKPPPRFLLIYERKLTEREGERCRWREEVFIDSPEPGPSRRPWRDLAQFELYQGLRLINTLSEKELITKAE